MDSELTALWQRMESVMRRSAQPMNVLTIRHGLQMRTKPKVKKLNHIMYQQLSRGKVVKLAPRRHARNMKPRWALASAQARNMKPTD